MEGAEAGKAAAKEPTSVRWEHGEKVACEWGEGGEEGWRGGKSGVEVTAPLGNAEM